MCFKSSTTTVLVDLFCSSSVSLNLSESAGRSVRQLHVNWILGFREMVTKLTINLW